MFKVAGEIKLKSALNIGKGDVTIAGHTAPGDGIVIRDNFVQISASNVIIRYMRFRMGDVTNIEGDAIWGRNQKNIIIDHCSMSWSTDEAASFYDNENFTLQWSYIYESLRVSAHEKGNHGFGGIWGGKKASFHHNLLAHHDSRNPRFNGSRYSGDASVELVDFRNNVIYNWGGNSGYAGEGGSYNMVNNYYQPGAESNNAARIFAPDPDNGENNKQNTGVWGKFYVSGNIMKNKDGSTNTAVTNDNWQGIHPRDNKNKNDLKSNTEFNKGDIVTHTAQQAYDLVLAQGGASFKRDATDARVVDEVKNLKAPKRASGNDGTKAGMIDTQNDVGGWATYSYKTSDVPVDTDGDGIPDKWEDDNGLNKNNASDANSTSLMGGSGKYTNIEVYHYDIIAKKSDTTPQLSSSSSEPQSSSSSSANPQISGTLVKELSVTAATWSIQSSVQVGDSIYEDREATWTALPSSVAGKEYIRTTVDPKDATLNTQATFKAGAEITVFVLLDKRVIECSGCTDSDKRGLPSWLNGWERLEETASTTGEYYIYEKDFSEGETVTLGSNGLTTATVLNYAVAVALQEGTVLPSSSSEGRTPILHSPFSILHSEISQYYNLRGEPLGSTKPQTAGIYIVKQGSSVKKIVVR